jgi:hypothetical protein
MQALEQKTGVRRLPNSGGIERKKSSVPSSQYHNTTKAEKINIYIAGKIVGYVANDTFYKRFAGSKHMLRKPPAIAFDVSSLEQAKAAGAEVVKVTDKETGITYTATILHIFAKGKKFNRGYGEQIYLAMNGWTRRGKGIATQRTLFEGGGA